MTKKEFEQTIWINTIHDYAEPKKWVALPLIGTTVDSVTILDAYGERVTIKTAIINRNDGA